MCKIKKLDYLKKGFIILTFILFSCENKNAGHSPKFNGFGDLVIGAEFRNLKFYRMFKKEDEDTYSIEKYKLSPEIGIVENVTIKLYKGRISDVNFKEGKYTSTNNLENDLNFDKDISDKLSSDNQDYKVYNSKYSKISFTQIEITTKYKHEKINDGWDIDDFPKEYSYGDGKYYNDFAKKQDSSERIKYFNDK